MKTSTGDYSTGNYSTGYYSTGDYSTGNYSTGNYSTGYFSTGNRSTGNRSTGDFSTGNRSTGDFSTGDFSTGYFSTGDWSISDYSTGHFSTIDYSGFGVFDKPCTPEEWNKAKKPDFIFFDLIEWIFEKDMTDEEKENKPTYKTTGGYLKVYTYQEAWKNAWNKATDEDKELLYKLPNFDWEVFTKISGIEKPSEKVELTLDEIAEKFGIKVSNLKIKK